MEQISTSGFTKLSFKLPEPTKTITNPRNKKEQLIEDIIQACALSDKEKKTLAKRIALAMNIGHWTVTDLYVLLGKRNDPTIRNYTAFVKWSASIKFTKA